ncbi:MAG: aldolase/citrate lyase family protein [Candidatus Poribacteria bacterium]
MQGRKVALAGAFATFLVLTAAWPASAQREQGWAVRESLTNPDVPLYNTAKQKLLDGGQVFTYTIARLDTEFYCEVAPHYDFIFFEMQHSTMSWADVEAMIAACPGVGVPMVRLPDVLEGSIQKATDIGALGVIGPTINTAEQAMALADLARFPPEGRRSAGLSQAARVWRGTGQNYRQTINDNMLVVAQIETPIGVENAYHIARVSGIDVLWASNGDLGNFSGLSPTSPEWHAMFDKVKEGALRAGKFVGSTSAAYANTGPNGRPDAADWRFFYGGPSMDGFQPQRR